MSSAGADPQEAQLRREECRREVRAYLAERPVLAMRLAAIVRGVREAGGFAEAEVEAALGFLYDLEQVKQLRPEIGATVSWQITARGTLAYEREA